MCFSPVRCVMLHGVGWRGASPPQHCCALRYLRCKPDFISLPVLSDLMARAVLMRQSVFHYLPSKSPLRSVTTIKGPLHLPLEPMHVAEGYGSAVGTVTRLGDRQQTNRELAAVRDKRYAQLYYIRNQKDATLAVSFISHCKITLHVSDAFCVHHQEY